MNTYIKRIAPIFRWALISNFLIMCSMGHCFDYMHTQSPTIKPNMLKNVEYNPRVSDFLPIELGSIKLYFESEPFVNAIPTLSANQSVFFFPLSYIGNNELHRSLHAISQLDNNFYSIKVEAVQVPVKGIKVSIGYDPNAVEVMYEKFQAYDRRQGIIFRMHNRALLKKIAKKEQALLAII